MCLLVLLFYFTAAPILILGSNTCPAHHQSVGQCPYWEEDACTSARCCWQQGTCYLRECHCVDPSEPCGDYTSTDQALCVTGCEQGWVGAACHIEIPRLTGTVWTTYVKPTSVGLRWSAEYVGDGPITEYQVYYYRTGERDYAESKRAKHTFCSVSGLEPELQYTFLVYPVFEGNILGIPIEAITASTCSASPGQPRNVQLTKHDTADNANISVGLTWEKPVQISTCLNLVRRYYIYTRSSPSDPWQLWKSVKRRQMNIEFHNIDPFRNVSMAVSVQDARHRIGPKAVVHFQGKSTVPVAVEHEVISDGIRVDWLPPTHPNGDILGYQVQYKAAEDTSRCTTASGVWAEPQMVPSHLTHTVLTGLHPYTAYTIALQCVTGAGPGERAIISATTSTLPPTQRIIDVEVSDVTSNSAYVTWSPVHCVHLYGSLMHYKYEVYIDRISSANLLTTDYTNNTYLQLDNLQPARSYVVVVTFVNQHNQMAPMSDETHIHTLEDAPSEIRTVELTSDIHTIQVTWLPPSTTNGILRFYEISYTAHTQPETLNSLEPADNVTHTDRVMPDRLTHMITNLHPATSYVVKIRACTAAGCSIWSNMMTIQTKKDAPGAPVGFRNISRTADSVGLAWQPPHRYEQAALYYKIQCLVAHQATDGAVEPSKGYRTQATSVILEGLHSATHYVCTVCTDTAQHGCVEHVELHVHTLAQASIDIMVPQVELSRTTDHTITVRLADSTRDSDATHSASTLEFSDRVYYVVLETDTSSSTSTSTTSSKHKHPAKRSTPDVAATPCDLHIDQLLQLTYKTAVQAGSHCYVTAALYTLQGHTLFTIGDNATYHGYYNSPLHKDQQYHVWTAVVDTYDGVAVAAYKKTDMPAIASATHALTSMSSSSNSSTASTTTLTTIAIVTVAAVVVLSIILVVVLLKRKAGDRRGVVLVSSNGSQYSGGSVAGVGTSVPPGASNGIDNHDDGYHTIQPQHLHLHHARATHVGGGDASAGMKEAAPEMDKSDFITHAGIELDECDDLVDTPEDEKHPLFKPNPNKYKAISVERLPQYIKDMEVTRCDALNKEYQELPAGLHKPCKHALLPHNKQKNRYANIIAYDHSRVVLDDTNSDNDYINANYVHGYKKKNVFIAAQGPSRHTVNDMWRMVWHKDCSRIVMVTNLVENMMHKCEAYWPESSNTYDDIQVTVIGTEQQATYTIRTLQLQKGTDMKLVRHFHFTSWPDHGVPQYAMSLLNFRRKIRSYDDNKGPIVVHCSAGVGRTGTFIAIDHLLDQAKAEGRVGVYECVLAMREQRVNMVQTYDQYEFVYKAILEAVMCGDTCIECVDLHSAYDDLCETSDESKKSALLKQYELLTSMSAPKESRCHAATSPENQNKNRNSSIVPLDDFHRVYLQTFLPGVGNYINAVFVDGFMRQDAYIATQLPLADTILAFWCMIRDHGIRTIVMCSQHDHQSSGCYWPHDMAIVSYGPFTIQLLATDQTQQDVTIRDIQLTYNKEISNSVIVRQFQYHAWPDSMVTPINVTSFLHLQLLVEKWQQQSGNTTTIVHCLDGASQSGVYVTMSHIIERLKLERQVDVFQSSKQCRIPRPMFITCLEQYKFLYQAAMEYIDSFETYSNFK